MRVLPVRPVIALCGALCCLGGMLLGVGTGPIRAGEDVTAFGDSVTLNAPGVAARRLASVDDFIEDEAWDAAIDAAIEVSREFADALVEVAPGRYVNVHDACQSRMTRLPMAGRQRYRERFGDATARQYQQAIAARDPAALQEIVTQHLASDAAADALWTLGDWAWRRGELTQARRCWSRLIPLSPDEPDPPLVLRSPVPQRDPAEIRARLALCSLMEGDRVRAAREIEAFRQLHPDANGRLGGREGLWHDLLLEELKSSDVWRTLPEPGTTRTFAADPMRTGRFASLEGLGGPRWRVELSPTDQPEEPAGRPISARPLLPVGTEEAVFVNDGARVSAVRTLDGRPLWPLAADEFDSVIYESPWNIADASGRLPDRGASWFSGVVHAGRYCTRMGPSVVVPGQELKPLESRIISLDVGQGEGVLAWSVSAADLLPERGWSFTGAPLAAGDRLYCAIRRAEPQIESGIACLLAADGRLVWRTRVCGALRQREPNRHTLGHDLLTWGAGLVFLSTDYGAVAALDADSGRIKWVRTYRSTPPTFAVPYGAESASGLMPAVFDRDVVYVVPNDTRMMLALDADSGLVRWSSDRPASLRHVLGVADGTLVVSGDQLWGIDNGSGKVRWRMGFEDPAGAGVGRGLLAGETAYWTTHEDLFAVDVATGAIRQRVPLRRWGLSGGNLARANGGLLLTTERQLVFLAEAGGSGAVAETSPEGQNPPTGPPQ